MTLVIGTPWSFLPRDPMPCPGTPWAHSSPSFLPCLLCPLLPYYSSASKRPWIQPWKVCLESPLHWCCERTTLQVSRGISARVMIKACIEPSQGTTLQAVNPGAGGGKNKNHKQKAPHQISALLLRYLLAASEASLQGGSALGLYTHTVSVRSKYGERLGRMPACPFSQILPPYDLTAICSCQRVISLCAW